MFYLSDEEELKAAEVRRWFDDLNEKKRIERNLADLNAIFPGEVVMVVDFCYSRTFLEQISGPGRVIVGSSSNRVASVSKGKSFGSFFFEGVSKGWDAFRSFESARARIKASFDQEPYIDADGDQTPIYDVSGKRNPGTERDEQIARSIFIGGEFLNLSRLHPEIDTPALQKQSDGRYVLTAMADKELTLSLTTVPQAFDPEAFGGFPEQTMTVQDSVQDGNKQLYRIVWTPPGSGAYVLLVQGVDNLNNLAAHRAVEVTVEGAGLVGDFNGYGQVGFPDFVLFARQYGKTRESSGWDERFDLNGDGEVGFQDFVIFASVYGKAPVAAKSVIPAQQQPR